MQTFYSENLMSFPKGFYIWVRFRKRTQFRGVKTGSGSNLEGELSQELVAGSDAAPPSLFGCVSAGDSVQHPSRFIR
jgi:hypothetical protein